MHLTTINGGWGNDTYIYNLGDGNDTINDTFGSDKIVFGDSTLLNDISVQIIEDDMILSIKSDGQITLQNWQNNSINTIEFSDGSIEEIESLQQATQNDDVLSYKNSDITLDALAGNDIITVNNGENIITGNLGDDTINGGWGNDIYIYNLGDGIDTINDTSGTNKIVFGEDIVLNDIAVQIVEDDMVVSIKNDGQIILQNWMHSMVNTIEFSDGSIEEIESLQQATQNDDVLSYKNSDITLDALTGNDTIVLGKGNDTIYGNDGNDYIVNEYFDNGMTSSNYGSDQLYGNSGNDIIKSASGSDTLDGGSGDDVLEGFAGDDTYIFGRGYGNDTIKDENYFFYGDFKPLNAGNDTIEFKDDTIIDDLDWQFDGDNLVIALKEDGVEFENLADKITILNWKNYYNRVENIKFADGSTLTFTDAEANYTLTEASQTTPPIVLDMNLNGTTSISLEDSNAYFDYAGDGQREHTSWIEKGDALLVADLNNDGIINDGSELFGDYTKLPDGSMASDGYEALAQYDSNGDSIIDYKDENFSKLSLWSDFNQNGRTDEGELQNIQLSKVTAIHLTNENNTVFEQVTENGNLITNETIYETNSDSGVVRDIWFEYDESDYITNNDTLEASTTQNYLNLGDGDDTYIYALGYGLVTIGDNGDGNDTLKLEGIAQEQLEVLWNKNSDDLIIAIRESIDDTTAVTQLENQILIKDWFNESGSIESVMFSDGSTLNKDELFEILTSKKDFSRIIARVLEEDGQLEGGAYNDVLYGTTGNELLNGQDGHDYLKGNEGADELVGGFGDDTHYAGLGDDISTDIDGDEYYIYNKGDGKDTIIDANGEDLIVFGEGITIDDIIFKKDQDNLMVAINEDGIAFEDLHDVITIENYYIGTYQVEKLEFATGQILDIDEYLNSSVDTAISLVDIEENLLEDSILNGALIVEGNSDGIQYNIDSIASNATFTIDESGNYTYTPNENYNGIDIVTVSVTNEHGEMSSATLTFNVEAVNDVPIAREDSAVVAENAVLTLNAVEILANDSDVDQNDVFTIINVTTSSKGTVSLNENGDVVFDTGSDFDYLAVGQNEQVILNYEIQDSQGATSSSTITLNVTGTNDVPMITQIVGVEIREDENLFSGNIVAVDIDNNAIISYSTTQEVEGFTLNIDGTYSFNPSVEAYQSLSAGEVQTIIIPIIATDEHGETHTQDLSITIRGTNDAPIAREDSAVVAENAVLTLSAAEILANDSDVDENDVFTITNVTTSSKGTVSLNDNGDVVFDTGSDFDYLAVGKNEQVILNYDIQDSQGATSSSTITLNVTGTNDVPIVSNSIENITLKQEIKSQGQIIASDIDGDTLHYSVLNDASHGNIIVDENGKWTYNLDPTYKGNDSATILIDDQNGGTTTKTLNFTIDNNVVNGNKYSNFLFGNIWEESIINGLSGNDYLIGLNQNDILVGGLGKDILIGNNGDDILFGDEGNDTLQGGLGNDTYSFALGDGKDTVIESSLFNWLNLDKNDTITFEDGIEADDISFTWKRHNLFIQYSDTDYIKVRGQKYNTSIENFTLSDGSYLSSTDVESLIQDMISFADDNGIDLSNRTEVQSNEQLMNIVSNTWHHA